MKTIEIEEFEDLRNELEELDDEEVLVLSEDGKDKYMVVPLNLYEKYAEMFETEDGVENGEKAGVRVISSMPSDLTYEEYERVKKELIKALDETLKPNPEKLN